MRVNILQQLPDSNSSPFSKLPLQDPLSCLPEGRSSCGTLMEMLPGTFSWTWWKHPESLGTELLSAPSLCQRKRGDECAELDIYSTISPPSESLNRASGDGRKLRAREMTLPCSAISDGTIHGTAPASLGQEDCTQHFLHCSSSCH